MLAADPFGAAVICHGGGGERSGRAALPRTPARPGTSAARYCMAAAPALPPPVALGIARPHARNVAAPYSELARLHHRRRARRGARRIVTGASKPGMSLPAAVAGANAARTHVLELWRLQCFVSHLLGAVGAFVRRLVRAARPCHARNPRGAGRRRPTRRCCACRTAAKAPPRPSIRVRIPDGVIGVKPMPKPGWTLNTVTGKYPKTYKLFHAKVSEGVTEIAWSGGKLPDAHYDEFVFQANLADDLDARQDAVLPGGAGMREGRAPLDRDSGRGQGAGRLSGTGARPEAVAEALAARVVRRHRAVIASALAVALASCLQRRGLGACHAGEGRAGRRRGGRAGAVGAAADVQRAGLAARDPADRSGWRRRRARRDRGRGCTTLSVAVPTAAERHACPELARGLGRRPSGRRLAGLFDRRAERATGRRRISRRPIRPFAPRYGRRSLRSISACSSGSAAPSFGPGSLHRASARPAEPLIVTALVAGLIATRALGRPAGARCARSAAARDRRVRRPGRPALKPPTA